ncbi:MAG: AAA family ATPase [Clostridia bacterium]|nr:AAA family ATPase [Clostridia bacterium]
MKILELHILEFGGLCDRHIVLSDGLNIFEGENEAGKSTVWLFIKFMLYGMPRKGHEDRDRSVSWRTHRASGSMRVQYRGEEYRIERNFTESGRVGNDKLSIYRHLTGELVFAGKEAGEVFLGVPREVFESTCGIGQMQLSNLGGKKGADAIRNLLSGADETVDISHIEAKLDKLRVQYRHKNGKGGRLGELGTELNDAKKRLERAQDTEKNLILLEEKMQRNQAQAAQTEGRLAFVSERLTQLGTLELLRRFERLRAMEAQERVLDEEISTLRRRAQKTDRALCEADVAELRSLADHLRAAIARQDVRNEQKVRLLARKSYDEADAEIAEMLEREGGAASVLKKMKQLSRRTGLTVGAGVAIIALSAVGFFLHPLVALSALLGVALCIVGVIAGVERKKISSSFGQTPDTLEAYLIRCTAALDAKREMIRESTEIEAALSAAETLVREITEQLRTALLRTLPEAEVLPNATAAEMEMTRISAFLREQSGLCAKKAALTQSISNEREGLSQYDEAALRESLTLDLSELSGLDPVRLETERRFLKMQTQTLADSFQASQIELISAKANAQSPMAIADQVAILSAKYERADEYYQTLELTLGALSAAAETMSGNVTPALGRRAGEMMSYISAGRYETLTAGADYTPSLLDESRLTVPADLLSAGTSDAAYLSLRIALAMQLFSEELPPLMLDDALCQIDDRRIVRILTLLARLGEQDLQCLLFTCHQREAIVCEREMLPYTKHSL